MKYIHILILMLIAVTLHSCDKKVDKFPYTFFKTDIQFNKEGGNTTIISQSDEWTFGNCLLLDNQTINFPRCEEVFPDTEPQIQRAGTCSNDILTVKYDFMRKYLEPVQVEGSWFKLIKKTLKEASIVVSPNLSGKSRNFRVTVDPNGTTIVVTQYSE